MSERSFFAKLSSDTVKYALGSALNGLVAFLLIPLYTRALSAAEVGVYVLLEGFLLFVGMALNLGLQYAYLERYTHCDNNRERSQLFSTTVIAWLGLGAFLSWSAVALGLDGLSRLMLGNAVYVDLVRITLAIIFVEMFTNIIDSFLRAARRPWELSGLNLLAALLQIALSLYFVLNMGMGVAGVLLARLVARVVEWVVFLFLHPDQVKLLFSWPTLRALLRYGVPLVPGNLLSLVLLLSGRYLVGWLGSLEASAYFTIISKIAGMLSFLLVQPVNAAWGALAFENATFDSQDQRFSQAILTFFYMGAVMAVGMTCIGPELIHVFSTDEYLAALSALPVILLAYVFLALNFPCATGLYLSRKTGWISVIYALASIVCVGLSVVLIPRMGVVGAAISLLASQVFLDAAAIVLSRRFYPMNSNWKRIVLIALVMSPSWWMGVLWQPDAFEWRGLLTRLLVGVVSLLAGLAVWLFSFSAQQRIQMRQAILARVPFLMR